MSSFLHAANRRIRSRGSENKPSAETFSSSTDSVVAKKSKPNREYSVLSKTKRAVSVKKSHVTVDAHGTKQNNAHRGEVSGSQAKEHSGVLKAVNVSSKPNLKSSANRQTKSPRTFSTNVGSGDKLKALIGVKKKTSLNRRMSLGNFSIVSASRLAMADCSYDFASGASPFMKMNKNVVKAERDVFKK